MAETKEDPQVTINRGLRANAILDNDEFKRAFETLEHRFISEWKICPDMRKRDRLWIYIKLLNGLKAELSRVMANGGVEEIQQKYNARGIPNG